MFTTWSLKAMPRSGGCLVFIWFARKEIEPEWSAYLVESLDDRLAADYDVETSFSKEDARGDCRRSREFLRRVRRYLLKKGLQERELRMKDLV
jgi:uncharacterized protein (UPF0332 family)